MRVLKIVVGVLLYVPIAIIFSLQFPSIKSYIIFLKEYIAFIKHPEV